MTEGLVEILSLTLTELTEIRGHRALRDSGTMGKYISIDNGYRRTFGPIRFRQELIDILNSRNAFSL